LLPNHSGPNYNYISNNKIQTDSYCGQRAENLALLQSLGCALAGVASPMCQISAAIHEHHKKQLWREYVRVGRGISKNAKRKQSAYLGCQLI